MWDRADGATTMSPSFAAPRGALDRKPKHGQPCNGCGLCCVASLCQLGQHVFHRQALPGPCPALVEVVGADHPTFVCGLTVVGDPAYRAAAKTIIGAGLGCDARFNGEPPDRDFYMRLAEDDATRADEIKAAKKLWGM